MRTTWRTCGEHPHCQEEIQQSQWDDRPNTHVVVHHRDAAAQPDSPRAVEGPAPDGRLDDLETTAANIADALDVLTVLVYDRREMRRARRAARKARRAG